MSKDTKILIVFMVVFIGLIIALVAFENSKENKKNATNEKNRVVTNQENQNKNQKKELIKPAKYQDIGTNYPIATITMNGGKKIKVELYPNIAPTTVENFISLANSGFYDGLTFHRAAKNFVIQGGAPEADGKGGPGYSITGEFEANGYENELTHNVGVISMARSGSYDSAGSQFFIVTNDNAKLSLDGLYAGFGKVIEGMDVVEGIEKLDAENQIIINKPVIKSITVDTKGIKYDEPAKIEK